MKTSKLWDSLAKEKFAEIDGVFLSNFREPGNANNRLAAWDPFDRSMRYFKFLFFHQIQAKEKSFFAFYEKVGSTNLGNPVTLNGPSGTKLNLDHFFSIEEYVFLNANLDFDKIDNIVEIGAGFGRTAQALVKLVPNIYKYTIIDIPEVLSLSRSYLRQVLDEAEFAKFEFLNAFELKHNDVRSESIDLVINIDSFQEMPADTVRFYLDNFVKNARYFYSKNPVGKYRPESVGLDDVNEGQLLDVFSLGLSTDIIDIFDVDDLLKARGNHVEQYRPAPSFEVVAQEPLGIFPYYLSVLYARL